MRLWPFDHCDLLTKKEDRDPGKDPFKQDQGLRSENLSTRLGSRAPPPERPARPPATPHAVAQSGRQLLGQTSHGAGPGRPHPFLEGRVGRTGAWTLVTCWLPGGACLSPNVQPSLTGANLNMSLKKGPGHSEPYVCSKKLCLLPG